MQNAFSLSVIIPVRNRAHIITRTLSSIATQTVLPKNIIIVDNASSDDTLSHINEWIEHNRLDGVNIKVVRENAIGVSNARNRGLQEVDSDYVMFFDSDDEMKYDHIQRISLRLTNDTSIDLLYFDIASIDDDGWMTVKSVNDTNLLRAHILHSALATTRFVASTELIKRTGLWNPELPVWNDLEYGIRLVLNASNPQKLPGEPRVFVKTHPDSISSVPITMNGHQKELALKTIEHHLNTSDRIAPKKWLASRRMMLAAEYHLAGMHSDSQRLISETLTDATTIREAMILRLINLSIRIFRHGGAALATAMFREPSPKNAD